MVAGSFSFELTASVSCERLWKAFVCDDVNLLPKILPEYITGSECRGDGGVGSIKIYKFNTAAAPQYDVIKNQIEVLDHSSHVTKWKIVEGGFIGTKLKSECIEIKFEAAGAGSCVAKFNVEYETIGDAPLAEEVMEKIKKGNCGAIKKVEAHLIANPAVPQYDVIKNQIEVLDHSSHVTKYKIVEGGFIGTKLIEVGVHREQVRSRRRGFLRCEVQRRVRDRRRRASRRGGRGADQESDVWSGEESRSASVHNWDAMEDDYWSRSHAATDRRQPALQSMFGEALSAAGLSFPDRGVALLDACLGPEEKIIGGAAEDDDCRAELPCPFCAEEFDVIGLCCHIDEEHAGESTNGFFFFRAQNENLIFMWFRREKLSFKMLITRAIVL
ncbi:hypothetical protein Cni_G24597 [Canna indica]|uniref:Bet v I/Major latex protein domain-containing protein n=1 Tax=Canna indica TaxID=4628 RepID=A0AAQ3QK94_9LILI|nr:hypothetical protein Cni_G24597 [Canna indica]